MNFTWEKTEEKDFETFNKWHMEAIFKAGKEQDPITKYLAPKTILLGNVIKMLTGEKSDLKWESITAKLNGVAVGFVAFSRETKLENNVPILQLNIEVIAVDPSCVGKGVGTAMIFDIVKNKEKLFGLKIHKFSTKIERENRPSQNAFLKNGFIKTSSEFSYLFDKYVLDCKKEMPSKSFELSEAIKETLEYCLKYKNKEK